MRYLVTIATTRPGTTHTEYHTFSVQGFQNAEAVQRSLAHIPTVSVTFEPDVFAYLKLSAPNAAA